MREFCAGPYTAALSVLVHALIKENWENRKSTLENPQLKWQVEFNNKLLSAYATGVANRSAIYLSFFHLLEDSPSSAIT